MTVMDPTAAALLAATPLVPIPRFGPSPDINALREAQSGYGFALGSDGLMTICRRAWLELDFRMPLVDPSLPNGRNTVPFGPCWTDHLRMRCGKIPAAIYDQIIEHFQAAYPYEAGCFVLWNEVNEEWALHLATALNATTTHLKYETPVPAPGWHVVLDAHSHGSGSAFFSSTDDQDDRGSTKISMVVGCLDRAGQGAHEVLYRLCANGAFFQINLSPFEDAL